MPTHEFLDFSAITYYDFLIFSAKLFHVKIQKKHCKAAKRQTLLAFTPARMQ